MTAKERRLLIDTAKVLAFFCHPGQSMHLNGLVREVESEAMPHDVLDASPAGLSADAPGDNKQDGACFVCGKPMGQPPDRCPGHYLGTSSAPAETAGDYFADQRYADAKPPCPTCGGIHSVAARPCPDCGGKVEAK